MFLRCGRFAIEALRHHFAGQGHTNRLVCTPAAPAVEWIACIHAVRFVIGRPLMQVKQVVRWSVVLAFVFTAASALAADWPHFRGADRDGKSADTGLLKAWPEAGPTELWTAEGLGAGFSEPVVVGDTIYVTGTEGDTGYVNVLSTDGTLLRKMPYGQDWSKDKPGARTTPTVEDGRLYLMTAFGRAVCLDAETGETVWERDTREDFGAQILRWGMAESLLVLEDKVICTPGGAGATVAALDKQTGETAWIFLEVLDKSGYSSPILIERGGRSTIVVLTGGGLLGIDPATGKAIWTQLHDAQYGIHATSPVYEDGRIYVTSGYGGVRGAMYELSADGTAATEKWTDGNLDCHHGGVIVHEGFVYGASDRNKRGNWICLNLETGEVVSEIEGVGKGSSAFADGMVYGYGEGGQVALMEPARADFRVVSSFSVTKGSGTHWSHPVIANGVLYIRHGDALMAYDVKAP